MGRGFESLPGRQARANDLGSSLILALDFKMRTFYTYTGKNYGGCSSVGRALDCDSSGRGFEPHQPPHFSAMDTHWGR